MFLLQRTLFFTNIYTYKKNDRKEVSPHHQIIRAQSVNIPAQLDLPQISTNQTIPITGHGACVYMEVIALPLLIFKIKNAKSFDQKLYR